MTARTAAERTRAALLALAIVSAGAAGVVAARPDLLPGPAHRTCDLEGGIWDGARCTRPDSPIHGVAL